ncbi:hypothetical protein Ae201684P_010375 [Aphanomyces euteiches]|nr:hypothetical protein Ae201684P_010375 [Aphanomyces euteiches]
MLGPRKGKGKAKVRAQSRETTKNVSKSKVATRKESFDSMEDELEEMTGAWIEVLQDEVKLLEYILARLKKGATPLSTALITARAQINAFEKKNQELRTMAENREKLKAWLATWVNTFIVHQV